MNSEKVIFLVEDTSSAQFLYKEVIQSIGYQSMAFNSGEAILKYLETGLVCPNLILLDVGLQGMNGVQCLKNIRSNFTSLARVPIVAITAHVMKHEVKDYERQGFDRVLQKPIKYSILIETITLLCGKHEGVYCE